MKFVKTEGTEELANALVEALSSALKGARPVLWLVPGGSNIKTAINVIDRLPDEHLENLTIMLSDERYGEPGHLDSNYKQFIDQGFKARTATFVDRLTGMSLSDTVKNFAMNAELNFSKSGTVIAFLGMGPDNHIAGILPNSPATTTENIWVVGYDGGQFQRMTLTPYALSHVHTVFVGAYGTEKKPALEKLCTVLEPITAQPSRILCHLPAVTIYNDQIEGDV